MKRVASVLLVGLLGCATAPVRPSESGGGIRGEAVPLITTPANWEEGFRQLVGRCRADEAERARRVDFNTAFIWAYTAAAVGIGIYVVTQKHLDDATIGAAAVGGIAATADVVSLVQAYRGRTAAASEIEDERHHMLEQWDHTPPEGRDALVSQVALRCDEVNLAAAYRNALGPAR